MNLGGNWSEKTGLPEYVHFYSKYTSERIVMAVRRKTFLKITNLILYVHFYISKCLSSFELTHIIKDGTFLCTLKPISALHLT